MKNILIVVLSTLLTATIIALFGLSGLWFKPSTHSKSQPITSDTYPIKDAVVSYPQPLQTTTYTDPSPVNAPPKDVSLPDTCTNEDEASLKTYQQDLNSINDYLSKEYGSNSIIPIVYKQKINTYESNIQTELNKGCQ